MKTLALLCIALIVCSAMATSVRAPSLATIKRIEKLQQEKNSWSNLILKMAFLQAKANNPLDSLIAAIQKVVADIDTKTEKENQDFDLITGEHNAEVKRLNREIDNANADIARTETFLAEVLFVVKATLEKEIAELQADIAKTQKFLEEIKIKRDAEHNDYLAKLADATGAIEAVNEAWELLGSLLDGGASLAQISKAKQQFIKLQKHLSKKSVDQTIVKALLQLTTDFSDSKLVRQVLDMLNDVRNALKAAIEKFNTEEDTAQVDYDNLVVEKKQEIKGFEAATIEKKGQLAATERKIEINQAFVAQRKTDLADFTATLNNENKNYDIATTAHNDLLAELLKEANACKEALDILKSAEFSGYLADRINNAGNGPVIAQHSGTGRAEINVTGKN